MGLAGVGIGLRSEHWAELTRPLAGTDLDLIDWLEIVPENFVANGGRARTVLDACRERWPIGLHGVSLSLGGPDPLDDGLLAGLARLADDLDAEHYSEHASWSAAHGRHFHDLLPLPATRAMAEHLASRASAVARVLGRPLLLENITYYAVMPTGDEEPIAEGTWLRWVLEASGAGLLLDVNNVYVNARNHGLDPSALLASLPLEHTRRIHLAGHVAREGMLVDNHGRPVADAVWSLFAEALERTGPVPTLIEWDLDVPPLAVVLEEVVRARRCHAASRERRAA